jgi:putative transposase
MIKAYKYRLYPSSGQQRLLNQLLEECRWLYNRTLAYRKDAWEQEQKRVIGKRAFRGKLPPETSRMKPSG